MHNIANADITHASIENAKLPVLLAISLFLKKIPAPTVEPMVKSITERKVTFFLTILFPILLN
jgi:hypothetical protein